jgi:hypothetical protein
VRRDETRSNVTRRLRSILKFFSLAQFDRGRAEKILLSHFRANTQGDFRKFFKNLLEKFSPMAIMVFRRQRHSSDVAPLFGMLEEHQIYPAMLVILTNVLEP